MKTLCTGRDRIKGKSHLYFRGALGHLKLSAEEARKLRKANEQRYSRLVSHWRARV